MKSFNNKLKLMLTLLCLTWCFVSSAQQRGIDEKYNFSGSFNRVRGTQSCLFTASQTGNKVVGRINFSNPRIQGNYTGTITNGVVHATITWVSAPDDLKKATFLRLQKFTDRNFPELSLFDNANYRTNNRVRPKIVYGLEKKVFGSTSTTAQNNPSSVANSNTKAARDIGGYYRIEGMTDATGTKRNLFVNVRNFPDNKDKSKAYGEALIIGEAYGIGSPQGKLFGYETNGDNVTVMFDPIFEQNKKVTMANGRIVNTSGGMSLVAPKLAYRMVKVSQSEAEANSKVTDYEYKVTVIGILINNEFSTSSSPKLYGNIRVNGILETRTDRRKLKNNQNQSDLVWNVSKSASKSARSNIKSYQDKQKNLFFATGSRGLKFYKFSTDIIGSNKYRNGVSVFVPLELSRTFSVRPEWLSGVDQRFLFEVYAELFDDSGTIATLDFGKKTRRVYLHEANDFDKLWSSEKSANRSINSNSEIDGNPVSAPYYYQVNNHDGAGIGVFRTNKWSTVLFKIEKVER